MPSLEQPLSLDEVLAQIRSGEMDPEIGYQSIFRDITPYLWRVIRNVAGNILDEEVADIAATALRDIWSRIDTFDSNKASFRTWASTIARNKTVDYLRTQESKPRTVELTSSTGFSATSRSLPEEEAIAKEIRDIVLSALGKLSKEDMYLYLLRISFDLSYKELTQIASEAGFDLTESAIKNRIHRTKMKLVNVIERKSDERA